MWVFGILGYRVIWLITLVIYRLKLFNAGSLPMKVLEKRPKTVNLVNLDIELLGYFS